jgi:steroid delta-isomerase-like uncharacterized protein
MSTATEHAQRWITALTSDTDAVVALYADDIVYDDHRDRDHVFDTATTTDGVRERVAPFANADTDNGLGVHRFEILDVIETHGSNGAAAVTILWRWTGEHLESFRGVPAAGHTLSARGQTWHQLDSAGKVNRESTFWNDVPVYRQLGLQVGTPEYWKADFDIDTAVLV